MKKNNKGITMVSLIITIIVMIIVAGTTIHTSLDRFKINELSKMYNDIQLLSDKVANYYLEYNRLPVVRDNSNNPIVYPVSSLNFDKNINDNTNYYILDLEAMNGLALNYGKEGLTNPNASAKDIYIVNDASHTIYYVKGIEVKGIIYHTLSNDENKIKDNIPPSKPEIKIISGQQNSSGTYISEVELEIVPGKDSWSGIENTTYSINNGTETNISTLENNIYQILTDGDYAIKVKSYDKNANVSEIEVNLKIKIDHSEIDHSEIVVPTINKTGVFENNPNIAEVRKENIPIPTGFTYVKGDIEGGAVIRDESDNEFVWIPVETLNEFARTDNIPDENGKINYKSVLYNFAGTTATEIENNVNKEPVNLSYDNTDQIPTWSETLYQEKFNKMIESVKEYKGFYVGRYEMGLDKSGIALSKLGETPKSGVKWYELYTKAETYAPENSSKSVVSEMIWGCQWDAMLKYILTTDDVACVTTATNVSHNVSRYKTGGINYKGSIEYNDKLANIYDLEGNYDEFTQEASSIYRVWRGGSGDIAYSPSKRSGDLPGSTIGRNSTRLALYIK